MKYRITEVLPQNLLDRYYEVQEEISVPDSAVKLWEFRAMFTEIDACYRYIQDKAPAKRKVISEIEV